MKQVNNHIIIGIDHGYGNIKTANHCFKTGVLSYDSEPAFTQDMLIYNGRYYLFGEGHKEFFAEETNDDEYYIMTLAAIAKELESEDLREAAIVIAAGLPLTWMSGQKEAFAAYLLQNETVTFVFNRKRFYIHFAGVKIYPQGFAAVAEIISTLKGMTVIADIGNGTMNTLYLVNGKP